MCFCDGKMPGSVISAQLSRAERSFSQGVCSYSCCTRLCSLVEHVAWNKSCRWSLLSLQQTGEEERLGAKKINIRDKKNGEGELEPWALRGFQHQDGGMERSLSFSHLTGYRYNLYLYRSYLLAAEASYIVSLYFSSLRSQGLDWACFSRPLFLLPFDFDKESCSLTACASLDCLHF